MTQDVSITIYGLHAGVGENDDPIEVISIGHFSERNGKIYLTYDEEVEGETSPIRTLIKITGDCIEIARKGPINTNMIFKRNERTMTYYDTPYGSLDMSIFASVVRVDKSEDFVKAHTEYTIQVNGEFLADCGIDITVKPLAAGVKLM